MTSTPPPDTLAPPTPGSRLFSLCIAALIAIGSVGLTFLAFRRPGLDLIDVVDESYAALEWGQVGFWILGGLTAAWAATRQRTWRYALLAGWLGLLCVLAGLRELDLHVLLNPGNIHLLGLEESHAVRFRLDWWTDGATPMVPRIVWAVLFLALLAALILPFALARYPWPSRLLRRDLFPVLLAIGFGFLAGSYIIDDFLGRPLKRAGISISMVEETFELLGVCVIVSGIAVFGIRRGTPGQGAGSAGASAAA